MNSDKVKGAAKDVAGKAQRELGKLTGSEKQQVKGTMTQAEGKIDKGVGHLKDAFKDDKTR